MKRERINQNYEMPTAGYFAKERYGKHGIAMAKVRVSGQMRKSMWSSRAFRIFVIVFMGLFWIAACTAPGTSTVTSIPEAPASMASPVPTVLPSFTIQPSMTATVIPEKVLMRAIPSGDATFKIVNFVTNETIKLVDVASFLNQRSLGPLAWSPDGKHLLFHARNTALYVYSVETDEVQVLEQGGHMQGTGFNGFFDWSPDNTWIAAAGETSGVSKIYLMHPDGTDLHPISSHHFNGMAQGLSWTPDGQYLLFSVLKYAGNERSYYDIWMMDVDGNHPKELVKNVTGWMTDITVSPDGTTIYYQSDAGLYMASIHCYYENTCGEIPSKQVDGLPVTWYREFMPRWTGTYTTY